MSRLNAQANSAKHMTFIRNTGYSTVGASRKNAAITAKDFDTPAHVREAGKAAIDAGKTRYTDVPGTRELTAAIIRKFERDDVARLAARAADHEPHRAAAAVSPNMRLTYEPRTWWIGFSIVDRRPGSYSGSAIARCIDSIIERSSS